MNSTNHTIQKRQTEQKKELLENLKKSPVIQIAVQKAGIARSTYYRWRESDKKFTKQADKAIHDGILFINDLAESQLISAIKDKNITAIIFYLKTHHKDYADRLEIKGRLEQSKVELTKEQRKIVRQALKMASLD